MAHIGALDVLINYYDCRGFSGTSAGSLAAALAAAGFTSNEIINPKNRTTLLCHLDGVNSAMDLFDRWSRAKLFFALFLLRINLSPIGKFISIGFVRFLIFILVALLGFKIIISESWRAGSFEFLFYMFLFATIAMVVLFRSNGFGLASLDKFECCLEVLLGKKLGKAVGEQVTFSDFGPLTDRPSLKMVATNLETGRLQLFSPETTPDVPVAQAVAASVCIPGVFAPRRISIKSDGGAEGLFYDGGLVSNLPAWCFDSERMIDADAVTFVISVGQEFLSAPSTKLQWLKRFAWTAIFGASELNHRGISRSLHIDLVTQNIETLDFDASFEKVISVIDENAKLVQDRIEREFDIRNVLEVGRDMFLENFKDIIAEAGPSKDLSIENETNPQDLDSIGHDSRDFRSPRDSDRDACSSASQAHLAPEIRIRAALSDISELSRVWLRTGMKKAKIDRYERFKAPEMPIVFHWQLGFEGQTDLAMPISPRSACGQALFRMTQGNFDPHVIAFDEPTGRAHNFLYAPQDNRADALTAKDLAWIVVLPVCFDAADGRARRYLFILDGTEIVWDDDAKFMDVLLFLQQTIQELLKVRFVGLPEIGNGVT